MYSGRPALRGLGAAEVVVVGGEPATVVVDVEQPLDRVALEQDEPAVGRQQPGEHGRPGVEVGQPDERRPGPCTAGRPSRRARAASSSTSARIQRAGAPVAAVSRAASSSIRGLKSIPITSSAPRFQSDRVSRPAGALEVDRPPAAAVQVADELELGREEVRATRSDQVDRLRRASPRSARRPRPRRAGWPRAWPADVRDSAGVAGRTSCGSSSVAGIDRV